MPKFAGRRLRASAFALIAGFSFGLAPAASPLPDLGDSSSRVLSGQEEKAIGRKVVRQLRGSGGYFDDPEVNAYLDSLGHRLLAT